MTDWPGARACLVDLGGCGRRSRRRSGKAEEETIAELSATTTTQPVVVWAPIRAAEDLRDTPLARAFQPIARRRPIRWNNLLSCRYGSRRLAWSSTAITSFTASSAGAPAARGPPA